MSPVRKRTARSINHSVCRLYQTIMKPLLPARADNRAPCVDMMCRVSSRPVLADVAVSSRGSGGGGGSGRGSGSGPCAAGSPGGSQLAGGIMIDRSHAASWNRSHLSLLSFCSSRTVVLCRITDFSYAPCAEQR